jgi:23S rRNA (pseudouridine1915-N3)-methyltransferase
MFCKTSIIGIGKTQKEFLVAENHYIKQIKTKITLDFNSGYPELSKEMQIEKESKFLLQKSDSLDFLICMDPAGQEYTTESFGSFLQKISMQSKSMAFIIGGSYGLSSDIKKNCNSVISLSKLTFPHQLARVILLEQIFRAETIISGKRYHK